MIGYGLKREFHLKAGVKLARGIFDLMTVV